MTYNITCICGNYLTLTLSSIYGCFMRVYCNGCSADLKSNAIIYHCMKINPIEHNNGFDLCENCFKNQLTHDRLNQVVDLLLFKNDHNNECNHNNYKECRSITRLLFSLKFYSRINIIENDNDAEMFRKFMNDIYYQVINDYIHLNNEHTHELEHINNHLIKNNECKISSC
eukprot:82707_1